MSSQRDYEFIQHEGFQSTFDSVSDEDDCQTIELALMEIRENPATVSKPMKAKYEGYRSHIKESYQIVFVICHECIGQGYVNKIDCKDCESIHGSDQKDPQPIIKLIDLDDISPMDRAS